MYTYKPYPKMVFTNKERTDFVIVNNEDEHKEILKEIEKEEQKEEQKVVKKKTKKKA